MERVTERLATAWRALDTLVEALNEPLTPLIRDAAIQRFEYTFEIAWKTARLYLLEVEGVQVGSPKGVIRACLQAGLLTEEQAWAWRWPTTATSPYTLTMRNWRKPSTVGCPHMPG